MESDVFIYLLLNCSLQHISECLRQTRVLSSAAVHFAVKCLYLNFLDTQTCTETMSRSLPFLICTFLLSHVFASQYSDSRFGHRCNQSTLGKGLQTEHHDQIFAVGVSVGGREFDSMLWRFAGRQWGIHGRVQVYDPTSTVSSGTCTMPLIDPNSTHVPGPGAGVFIPCSPPTYQFGFGNIKSSVLISMALYHRLAAHFLS